MGGPVLDHALWDVEIGSDLATLLVDGMATDALLAKDREAALRSFVALPTLTATS